MVLTFQQVINDCHWCVERTAPLPSALTNLPEKYSYTLPNMSFERLSLSPTLNENISIVSPRRVLSKSGRAKFSVVHRISFRFLF